MRIALAAIVTFLLSCCALSGLLSVLLAAFTGHGAAPLPYHVLLGLVVGALVAILPAAFVGWLVATRYSSSSK